MDFLDITLDLGAILIFTGLFFVFISLIYGGISINNFGAANIHASEKTRNFIRIFGIIVFVAGIIIHFNIFDINKTFDSEEVVVMAEISGFLALKEKPDINANKIFEISNGETITIFDCRSKVTRDNYNELGHWCRCNYKNKKGWIFDRYVVRKKTIKFNNKN